MSTDLIRAKEIFLQALKCAMGAERDAFLNEACGTDVELRRHVDILIDANDQAGSFLQGGALAAQRTIDQPITEKPGTQIGPYKLLQQLGEGGMGVVYMAEQKEPVKRRVALKIIKPGMDTRQVIARFEAERQALAMMDHPNIAKVLDAGQTESGRPYFVMELVNGLPVTKYCDEQHLTPKERLELFVPICQAVQHAHQKGIIHRDLKPSNILVALYDGQAVPKIIDFGVAKATNQTLTDKTMFTQLGQVVGTLEYMSPEQAERNQLDIDTRSDIYSLGVVLYELLTGETPFDRERLRSAAFDEMLRIIREEEPSKPSTKVSSSLSLPSIAANRRIEPARLGSMIRGELDWIVLKAMEKDRGRRYETASKFAEDVQHYLNDEAVVACPPTHAYRFRKFVRRNRALLSTAAVVGIALVLGIAGTTWQAVRATQAETAALASANNANEQATRARTAEARVREDKTTLEDSLTRETALRISEQEERERADENFARAHDAVNEFLTEVSEEDFKNLPGLQPLREKLLSSALSFYKQFVVEHDDDPGLQFELADAHRRIGHIHHQLGESSAGRAAIMRSLALFEALRQEHPSNERVLSSIAWLYHMYFSRHDEAIAIYRDLVSRAPRDEDHLIELAQTIHSKVSRAQLTEADSRTLLLEAEAHLRQVLEQNPESEIAANKLAFVLDGRGVLELNAGNLDLAPRYFDAAVQTGMAAFASRPTSIRLGAVTVQACRLAAFAHARQGHPDEALVWEQRRVDVARRLAYSNPQIPDGWTLLYKAYRGLAQRQKTSGLPEDARRSLLRATDIFANLDLPQFQDRVFLAKVYMELAKPIQGNELAESIKDRAHFFAKSVATLHEAFSTIGDLSEIEVRSVDAISVARALQDIALQISLNPAREASDLEVAELAARASVQVTTAQGSRAHAILALVQHRMGNQRLAAETVAESLQLRPNNSLGLVVAAMVAICQGEEESADTYVAQLDARPSEGSLNDELLTLRAEIDQLMHATGEIPPVLREH